MNRRKTLTPSPHPHPMQKLLSILLLITTCALCAQEKPATQDKTDALRYDAVLITVNGEPITRLDLLLECGGDEQLLKKITDDHQQFDAVEQIRRKKLEEIIYRKLVWIDYQQYRKQNPIPPQSIEDAVSTIARSLADGSREGLKRKLREIGVSMDEIRRRAMQEIAMHMMIEQFCYRHVHTTPLELREYYKKNITEFTDPQRRDIALIMIYDRGRYINPAGIVTKIKDGLAKSPAAFAELAILYSEAPGAKDSGLMGTYLDSELRDDFREVIQQLKPEQTTSDAFTVPGGTCFLQVVKNHPACVKPFSDVSNEIKARIEAPQRRANLERYLDRLRGNAIVRNYADAPADQRVYESDIVAPVKSDRRQERRDTNVPPGAVAPSPGFGTPTGM